MNANGLDRLWATEPVFLFTLLLGLVYLWEYFNNFYLSCLQLSTSGSALVPYAP